MLEHAGCLALGLLLLLSLALVLQKPPQGRRRADPITFPPAVGAPESRAVFSREPPSEWHRLFNTTQPLVTIRGEMSTGTGFLRELLKRNCPTVAFKPVDSGLPLDADSLYGWKHGVIGRREIELLQARPLHSMVVISRSAIPWIASLFRMARMGVLPRSQRRGSFHGFLNMQYAHSCPADFVSQVALTKYYLPPTSLRSEKCADGDYYSELNENVMKVRARRYKSWLAFADSSDGKVVALRQEDLKNNTLKTFKDLVRKLPGGLDEVTGEILPLSEFCHIETLNRLDDTPEKVKANPFDSINKEYIKFGGPSIKVIPDINVCDLFSDELGQDYDYFLQSLDQEFERTVLGYHYPSEFSHLCKKPPLKPSLLMARVDRVE